MKSKIAFVFVIVLAILFSFSLVVTDTRQKTEQTDFQQEIQNTDWNEVVHARSEMTDKQLHNSLTRHVRALETVETASPCRDTDRWQMYVSVKLSDSGEVVQIVPNFDNRVVTHEVIESSKYDCDSVTTRADYNGPAYGL